MSAWSGPTSPTRRVAFLEDGLPRLLPDRWRRAAGQGGAPAAKRGRTTL